MERALVILEVSQKQNYIFSSKELQQNARRSLEINWVTSADFLSEVTNSQFDEEKNLVYAGGGHTVLQFEGETKEEAKANAKAVVRAATEAVLKDFNGIDLFAKVIDYDEALTPGENLKALSKALEEKKSRRTAIFHQNSFGVEDLSSETYKPVACSEQDDSRKLKDLVELPSQWVYPKRFSELAGKDHFIAVVHVDGNSMGKRVDAVYQKFQNSWEECCKGLRAFSSGIQKDFTAAFVEMVETVAASVVDDKNQVPIRHVILAGDDVCFVTNGKIGLECARIFMERLQTKKNAVDKKTYAACAGVAIVHTKYPFHRAYDLSEQLCSSAKRFGAELDESGSVSAMDWHIEFGQLKDSLSALRKDYITEDELGQAVPQPRHLLTLRPVTVLVPNGISVPEVRTYRYFKDLCVKIQGGLDKVARSKIKELRTALKQGETESRYFLQDKQVRELIKTGSETEGSSAATDVPVTAFRNLGTEKKPDYRCLLFDAIEMTDHFTEIKAGG